eukprot:NODE_6237_length_522_cov_23.186047_g5470_i0.p1 GENE.NODE_6237_length_522_cov_23.186047_g5470_i0~~NODE_6237_length_522_cov_23.186047_g5470_i0.p1  ORF type:complete len:128 (+),score=32.15 NODE_6237_length_522_cov_23.186047_g5470_i0:39-386(+)
MCRALTCEILKTIGFTTVHAAEDAEHALRTYDEHPEIRLVMTDLHMDGMDGLELANALRSRPTYPSPVVFVLSGDQQDQATSQRCHEAGVAAYICKPVHRANLQQMVQQWLPPDP